MEPKNRASTNKCDGIVSLTMLITFKNDLSSILVAMAVQVLGLLVASVVLESSKIQINTSKYVPDISDALTRFSAPRILYSKCSSDSKIDGSLYRESIQICF